MQIVIFISATYQKGKILRYFVFDKPFYFVSFFKVIVLASDMTTIYPSCYVNLPYTRRSAYNHILINISFSVNKTPEIDAKVSACHSLWKYKRISHAELVLENSCRNLQKPTAQLYGLRSSNSAIKTPLDCVFIFRTIAGIFGTVSLIHGFEFCKPGAQIQVEYIFFIYR